MSFKRDLHSLLHWHPNWQRSHANWLLIGFLIFSAAVVVIIERQNLATPFLSSPALF